MRYLNGGSLGPGIALGEKGERSEPRSVGGGGRMVEPEHMSLMPLITLKNSRIDSQGDPSSLHSGLHRNAR